MDGHPEPESQQLPRRATRTSRQEPAQQRSRRRRRRWAAAAAFLKTIPGLLTAIATILTAIAGILAALVQLGAVQVQNPISVQMRSPIVVGSGTDNYVSAYLGEFAPTQSLGLTDSNAQAGLDGKTYLHSLLFDSAYGQCSAEYDLGRHYQRLKATLGVNDDAPADSKAIYEVFLDGRKASTATVQLGKPAALDLDVANVLRLRILMTPSGSSRFQTSLGEAQLLGAPDEVPTTTTQ